MAAGEGEAGEREYVTVSMREKLILDNILCR